MFTFTDKRPLITIIALLGILLTFWLGSRYPALDLKAVNGPDQLLADQLGFDAIVTITDQDSVYYKIGATTINWIDNNKKGMTFGLLLAAGLLSMFSLLKHKQFSNRFANTMFGVLIGAPLGVCVNCATPIAQGLYISGSRLETALATLFSSPTLNVIVLGILITMFPIHIVAVKIGVTLLFILLILPLITYFHERHQPAKIEPEAVETYTDKHSALHETDTALNIPYGWFASIKWFVISYIKNLFRIIRLALPLMIFAGFLGATVVSLVSWGELVNWLGSLSTTEQFLALSATSLFGLFLPVPIAFDVMLPATLQETGLPAMYVMSLLFSLGTFSIYPFMVIGRTISWRLAIQLTIILWLLTILGAYAVDYLEVSHDEKMRTLADQLVNVKQLEPNPTIQHTGKSLDELRPLLERQKLTYEETDISTTENIHIQKRKYRTPIPPLSNSLFDREHSLESGFLRMERQTPLIYLSSPMMESRPLAAGDIHGDGWPDLVLGTTKGIQLYANNQGKTFIQQKFDIPILRDTFILNVALVDLNNDNALDLAVTTLTKGNYIIYNDGGSFNPKLTRKLPSDKLHRITRAIAFDDTNNDGAMDIILGNYWNLSYTEIPHLGPMQPGENMILIAKGKKYLPFKLPGQASPTMVMLASDLNNSGYRDLSIGNDFIWPDVSYKNLGKKGLYKISRDDNIYPKLTRFTMSIDSADIDNDLDLEVYYGDISSNGSTSDPTGLNVVESLNDVCAHGEKELVEDCKYFNLLNRHSYAAKVDISDCSTYDDIDLKSDCLRIELIQWARRKSVNNGYCDKLHNTPRMKGWPPSCTSLKLLGQKRTFADKKMISKKALPQMSSNDSRNVLLSLTPDGRYEDIADLMGIKVSGWNWNAKFADLDNDQWQDLFIATGNLPRPIRETNVYYHNNQGKKFTDETIQSGLLDYNPTGSSVFIDMDNDGDLDIITAPFHAPPIIYRNQSTGNNSITIELMDEIGNATGIGSRITIYYGKDSKKHQVREIKASGGYQSFDPPVAHFGLGKHNEISEIEIRWSTGETTRISQSLSTGYQYRISRNIP